MISRQLAGFIVQKNHTFSEETTAVAKKCILDWLASALGGSRTDVGQIMGDYVLDLGRGGGATLIGRREKIPALHAALANGTASHVLELDDVHRTSIYHPGAAVIPAALALGEEKGIPGDLLLKAIILGYEVSIRIGEAVNPSHYDFWHTTGTCGTFGSAVAAGIICDLEEEAMVHALGNAGTQAAGLWEFVEDGAMSKSLHPGKAAMNGLLSAQLAQRGFTGAQSILEGKRGFCRATSQEFSLAAITTDLGSSYRIDGVSFKIHASCRHTHSAVDAIYRLKEQEGLQVDQIEKIRLFTYQNALHIAGNPHPQSPVQARFSLPFCMAAALFFHQLGPEVFTSTSLHHEGIKRLMSLVEMEVHGDIEGAYPEKWASQVEIFAGGKKYTASVDHPRGDPEAPLSFEEVAEKAMRLGQDTWSQERIEETIERIERIQTLEDCSRLFAFEDQ